MKHLFTCTILFFFTSLYGQESITPLEEARIVSSVYAGHVGNFVNLEGNELVFDCGDQNIDEIMANSCLHEMYQLLFFCVGEERMKGYIIAVKGKDANGKRQRFRPGFTVSNSRYTDTATAIRCFLNVMPYLAYYDYSSKGVAIVLKRVMGYSPIKPDEQYLAFLKWFYHRYFGINSAQAIKVLAEHGSDKKIKFRVSECGFNYDYDRLTEVIRQEINAPRRH